MFFLQSVELFLFFFGMTGSVVVSDWRHAAAVLFVCLFLPFAASSQTVNEKLVRARLMHDSATVASSADERVRLLREVETILASIVRENADSDAAVKLVSGEPVAGMVLDAVRVELATAQVRAVTQGYFFHATTADGGHIGCWTDVRMVCVRSPPGGNKVVSSGELGAGLLLQHSTVWLGDRIITNTISYVARDVVNYVAGLQAITARMTTVSVPAPGRGTNAVASEATSTVTVGLPREVGRLAGLRADGGTTAYLERQSTTVVVNAAGQVRPPATSIAYLIPEFGLAIPGDVLEAIKSGRFLLRRLDPVRALILAAGAGHRQATDRDRWIECMQAEFARQPAPPAWAVARLTAIAAEPDPEALLNSDPVAADLKRSRPVTPRGTEFEAWMQPLTEACEQGRQ